MISLLRTLLSWDILDEEGFLCILNYLTLVCYGMLLVSALCVLSREILQFEGLINMRSDICMGKELLKERDHKE